MNRNETNQYEMILSVEKFLEENAAMISGYPAFTQPITQLHSLTALIRESAETQAISTKGVTALKEGERKLLEAGAVKVNNALKAQAAADNNLRLKAVVNISPSDIKKLRENDFITRLRLIYNEASPIQDKLEVWGINQDDIKLLDRQINEFPQRTPGIRTVKAQSIQATQSIGETLKEASLLLRDKIDPMMLPFKTIKPEFYTQYKATRTIINRAATQSATSTDAPSQK